MGCPDCSQLCSCCTGTKLRRYLRSKVPFLPWVRNYNLKCLQGDIIAGLTVGLMVVPQGLAYAHLAELPPNFGLYSSFVGVLVYILTGTCKDITLGPTAIMSQIVAEVAMGNTRHAICLSMISGIFQILMGLFFLGFLVWVISSPVLYGFTTAAAITIGCSQLSKLLGIKGVRRQFWRNLYDTFSKIKQAKWPDATLGIICLIVLFSLRYLQKWVEAKNSKERYDPQQAPWKKYVFKTLWFLGLSRNIIVVIIATVISINIGTQDSSPLTMVGHITGGLPAPRIDQFMNLFNDSDAQCHTTPENLRWTCITDENSTQHECIVEKGCCWDPEGETKCFSKGFDIGQMISGSVLVASIGYLEHIAIGQSFAVKGGYQIDNSQELLAIGFANIAGSFFSAYPVTGSFSRTAVNFMSGVKTPLAGLFTAGIVMLGISFLTSFFAFVPDACLAAVIMVAVYPLVDFKKAFHFWKVSKKELFVWFTCFSLILLFNIEVGIGTAIAVDLLIIVGSNMWPKINIDHLQDGIFNFKIHGSVRYLGAFTVKEKLTEMINGNFIKDNPQHGVPVRSILIDFSTVTSIDSTALDKIRESVVLGNKKDVRIVGYGMIDSVKLAAAKQGLLLALVVEKNLENGKQSVQRADTERSSPEPGDDIIPYPNTSRADSYQRLPDPSEGD